MDDEIGNIQGVFSTISLFDVISVLASGAMVFGGVVPYIPQYRSIRKTRSAEGFSTLVCFVLLLANLLRVFFWFGKHFELPLLAQSLLMIAAMMLMVELCVRVTNQSEIIQARQHSFKELDWKYFWRWTDFLSYLECMLVLGVILSISTYLFIDNDAYVEAVGFLAVFIEAMLGTPQLYRNFTNGSTAGMSITMVMMWLSGDIFKTIYFVVNESPVQFSLCGAIQILVDIAILSQAGYYSLYTHRSSSAKHAN